MIDYKRLSGRYRIEENGKIKEYNSYNHELLFQGYFSNRKRNGEGIEYNEEGNIIFKGEYLDGKKWKGIENVYDEITSQLILECEYLNGIKEGKAKEYDKYNGQLIFSGNYSNGKRNGNGEE